MYIERFRFFCPHCKKRGIITDVLLNPELLLIRGRCSVCNLKSTYKAVDMVALQAEYEVLSHEIHPEDQPINTTATWNVLRFKITNA
jgi:hypothetical protein